MTQPWKTDWTKLYFSPKEKYFLAVAEAKDGLSKSEIGEPVVVLDSEFDSKIATVLTRFLDSFQSNVYSMEVARRGGTQEENRAFVKKHLAVSIERIGSGALVIRPLHHKGSGYVALSGEQILVPRDQMPYGIPGALREAFAVAT
jgi:hypothetical protein